MLSPKRTKFRKPHRNHFSGKASRGTTLLHGDFGLQAVEPHWLTSRQIEAGRRVLTRYVKKTGKLWIRVFPDHSVTVRPADTRMGSGKGAPDYWAAVVKPGKMIYEITGVSEQVAREAFRITAHKMPFKTKFIMK